MGEGAVSARAQPTVRQAGESRLATVESLRAVAALGVVLGHAWGYGHDFSLAAFDSYAGRLLYGGGFGVFVFFALTGYLLFWPFARRDFGAGAAIDLKRYALNRAVRVLPLYYAAVIALLVLQEGGGSGRQWWTFLLLAENFSASTIATVDGVLWSLIVEIHFYLLLPLLAFGLARVARGSKLTAAALLGGLGAISLTLWMVKVQGDGDGGPLWRYNLPATFFYFVPGMWLALLRVAWLEERPAWVRGPAASSGLWLAGALAVYLVVCGHFDRVPLMALAAFLAVGACVLPLTDSGPLRALAWRPLALLGVASYSLYVWHVPIMENLLTWDAFPTGWAAIAAITVPISIAVAFVSYRLIEEPFLRLRRRWSPASAPIDAEPGR